MGNCNSGFFRYFKLPDPLMVSFRVMASLALTWVELMELLNEKSPTPPMNEAGLPPGKGITSTEAVLVLTDRLTP